MKSWEDHEEEIISRYLDMDHTNARRKILTLKR